MFKPLFIFLLFTGPLFTYSQGYFYTEGTVQVNGGASIEIKGDAVMNQSIGGDGYIVMNGDNPQDLGGSSANMNNLEVSNSADVTLTDFIWVNDTLKMSSGIIYAEDNDIILADNSFHSGNTMGFIETNGTGYMQRKIDALPFTFHLGYGTEYFPLSLTETGTADTFYVQGWNSLPDNGNVFTGTPISNHAALLSYSVSDLIPGGNNLNITMQWNNSKNAPDFVEPYAIGIGYDGLNYVEMDNCPNNVSTIDPNMVSYTGITYVGTFGIGDSVYLTNIPTASITPGDTSICNGNTITFTALPAGASSYLWSNTDATQTSVVGLAGTYFVDITDSLGCVFRSGNVTFTLLPLPTVPTINQTGNDLSVGGGYTSYQWYLDGSPISGATGSTYTATSNGDYTVVVSGANGCTVSSSVYPFANTGLEDENGWSNLYVTSNNQQIYVSMIPDGNTTISIYDALGKVIITGAYTSQYISQVVEAGMYVVVLKNTQHQFVQKVILQ